MQNIVKNNKIKSAIPHGGVTEIAKIAGVTIFTVSRVLSGKSRNNKVLNAIAVYLDGLKSTNNKIASLIIELDEKFN